METRTFTTRRGRTVTTHLTDEAALAQLRTLTGNAFAQDLAARAAGRGLSHEQWTWAHIVALESLTPHEEAPTPVMAGALRLLTNAAKRLKRPKVRLAIDGRQVVLGLAGERSRHPGAVHVTDGGPYGDRRYFGRIDTDGAFQASRDADGDVIRLLARFAQEPAKVAAEHGRLTGRCAFCGQGLCDERSTAVGYGPICAEQYRLPFPTRAEAEELHEQLAA